MGARSLAGLILLPLVVTRLSTEEVTVWFLFNSILLLQMLADMGFGSTFSRAFSYAMGGAQHLGDYRVVSEQSTDEDPNWATAGQILGTMQTVYRWLALAWALALLTIGTWALGKPISLIPEPSSGWAAWALVVASSVLFVWYSGYAVFLQGSNEVAAFRRWDAVTSFAGIVTASIALLLGDSLVVAIAALQVWVPVKILVNKTLCRAVHSGAFRSLERSAKFEATVFGELWPPTWRSGVGILMSAGLIQASGFLFAQVGKPAQVASYLLALNLIRGVSSLSQAPFYSKLPLLARLRSQGKITEQVSLAAIGMRRSYLVYMTVFLALGIFGKPIFNIVGTNVEFPDGWLWNLFGMAILVERYGAMHLQLYSTTNHIVWHIANGISGTIFLFVALLGYPQFGVHVFPTGILAGNVGFYAWYSARYSYRAINAGFWRFEHNCLLPAVAVLSVYILCSVALGGGFHR